MTLPHIFDRRQRERLVRAAAELFPPRERWQLAAVFVISLVAAVFETAGVASILPFMTVIMDENAFEKYKLLQRVTPLFGGLRGVDRTLALGIIVAITIVASNAVSAAALWGQQRLAAVTRTRISVELLGGFLRQEYAFHTGHDSSVLLTALLNDIDAFSRLTAAAMQLVTRATVVIALSVLLLVQNPAVAMWTVVTLAGGYALIYRTVRRRQQHNGQVATQAYAERQRRAQEILAGVKELKVLGREQFAMQEFAVVAHRHSFSNSSNIVLSNLPRYILEPIAFCGILAVALSMLIRDPAATTRVIPTLTLYAFVGYRLLPALQQIYASASEMRFTLPAVQNLREFYRLSIPESVAVEASPTIDIQAPALEQLELHNVSFTHATAEAPAIDHLSLRIHGGESVGIVGRSGSGKTTLADLLLALYTPSDGEITVDGQPLAGEKIAMWRRRVGYVPQVVYLTNATVRENIAFGVPPREIDDAQVRRAAELACASDFIGMLPNGFDTVVGERGVMLSGGQRQRLGIARALYRNPTVLVFDEATSALDGVTERDVMQAIHGLKGDRTTLIIAHRLQTVRQCDRLLVLEAGQLVATGPFDELLETSPHFQDLARH